MHPPGSKSLIDVVRMGSKPFNPFCQDALQVFEVLRAQLVEFLPAHLVIKVDHPVSVSGDVTKERAAVF